MIPLKCNFYIVNNQGEIVDYYIPDGFKCEMTEHIVFKEMKFPEICNKILLNVKETQSNIISHGSCLFANSFICTKEIKYVSVIPINSSNERLGTMVAIKYNNEFTQEDLELAEYGAAAVGMKILRNKNDIFKDKKELQ